MATTTATKAKATSATPAPVKETPEKKPSTARKPRAKKEATTAEFVAPAAPAAEVTDASTLSTMSTTESLVGGKAKRALKPKKIMQNVQKQVVLLEKSVTTIRAQEEKELTLVKRQKLNANLEQSLNSLKDSVLQLQQSIVDKPSKNTSSGFMKKVLISKKLQDFGIREANWAANDCKEMSRVDATKAICMHIQKNDLGQSDDKRKIRVSKELKELFDINQDVISYPEIQKQIQQHFQPSLTA